MLQIDEQTFSSDIAQNFLKFFVLALTTAI